MTDARPPSEFCGAADAAAYLGVSQATLERWRNAEPTEGPPYYRLGRGTVRYTYADLDSWLSAQRVDPSAP